MAQRKLQTVLRDFSSTLIESRNLATDANRWSLRGESGRPLITLQRRDSMTELAFLRAFLAWESFLEESFVLYLSGQNPPRGRALVRYAFPPNQRLAHSWVVPEGRPYAKWTIAAEVASRAERFFRGGRPFSAILRANQNLLDETRLLRNAVAHNASGTQIKFETLARNKLGTLPPGLTVGGFLGTLAPGTTPPKSFFDFYIERIEFLAKQIVP